MSYEQWTPSPEPALSYYTSHPGPSYAPTFNLQMTPAYNTQQQIPTFGDSMSQSYVRDMLWLCTTYTCHVPAWNLTNVLEGLWVENCRIAQWQLWTPVHLRRGNFLIPVRLHNKFLFHQWTPASWGTPECSSMGWTTAARMKMETRESLFENSAWGL